jgi:hypothetical protein
VTSVTIAAISPGPRTIDAAVMAIRHLPGGAAAPRWAPTGGG